MEMPPLPKFQHTDKTSKNSGTASLISGGMELSEAESDGVWAPDGALRRGASHFQEAGKGW